MMITLSNPRLSAEFTDWPLGGSKRGVCRFEVHHEPRKGARVSRTTTGKPKMSTYHGLTVICDGSDGKTYIVCYSRHPSPDHAISVYSSDFKNPPEDVIPHYITRGNALHATLEALIAACYG